MVDFDLFSHNIDLAFNSWFLSDSIPDAWIAQVCSTLEHVAYGEMRGRVPIAWITPTEDLVPIWHSPNPAPASTARIALGLRHIPDDPKVRLIEVHYPAGAPSTIAPPTFVDGCTNCAFRSHEMTDSWGRTVRLDTLTSGVREAVHSPIPFTDAFSLADLGRVLPPGPSPSPEELLAAHPFHAASGDAFIEALQP
jgi:hypothetical protein